MTHSSKYHHAAVRAVILTDRFAAQKQGILGTRLAFATCPLASVYIAHLVRSISMPGNSGQLFAWNLKPKGQWHSPSFTILD